MAIPISNATRIPPPIEPKVALKSPPTANQQTQAAPAKPVARDTVHLSSASKPAVSAAAAALQEAIETPAQTAKEAAGGDVQAKNLLAKETARK